MEEIKIMLRVISICIGVSLYIGVWFSMIKNWDKCVMTDYNYPCFERFLGAFYLYWICIHAVGIVLAFIWAWL